MNVLPNWICFYNKNGDEFSIIGLSQEIDTEMLFSAFTAFGQISECRVIKDKLTNKGFGIVKFVLENDALKAIEQMNDNPCSGSR